jgi:hypothetical protein
MTVFMLHLSINNSVIGQLLILDILFPQERYFVPTTYYLVPSIYHFVPTTYHIVPSIYFYKADCHKKQLRSIPKFEQKFQKLRFSQNILLNLNNKTFVNIRSWPITELFIDKL